MTMVKKHEIPAGTFKAQCLRIMEEVRLTRTEVTITKRGVPVARLVPIESEAPELFDCMSGQAAIDGDLVAPTTEPEAWEASG